MVSVTEGKGKNPALDKIFDILSREQFPAREARRELQLALNEAGYSKNYQHYKDDGILGRMTLTDIASVLKDHPEAIGRLSQPMKKLLVNRGFGDELSVAVASDLATGATLVEQASKALGDAKEVTALSRDKLEIFQANAVLSGVYHGKVDGIAGEGSTEAFRIHRGEPETVVENVAPATPSQEPVKASAPAPLPPTIEEIEEIVIHSSQDLSPGQKETPPVAAANTAKNSTPSGKAAQEYLVMRTPQGNGYGVPAEAIEKSWAAVKSSGNGNEQPRVMTVSYAESQRPLVVIDPGHGTHHGDKGAISHHFNGLNEMKAVDPVARSLAAKLYEQGFDVAFTREPGATLPYEPKRGGPSSREIRPLFAHQLADNIGAREVYFISLHANSGARGAKGTLIFAGSHSDGDKSVTFGGRALNEGSTALASAIAGSMENAKAMTADATVITKFDEQPRSVSNHRAGVLIELAYLTNAGDAKKLSENPDAFAANIAQGIQDYHATVLQDRSLTVVADTRPMAPPQKFN